MNDGGIIELFFKRDERALEETAKIYGPYCFAVAKNILEDPRDAEECVSSAVLKAWESIPPARPERLGSWLAKLTRNIAINRYKAEKRQKRGGGEAALVLEELAEIVPSGQDPASETQYNELKAAVNAFLGELPERERAVFMRRCFFAEPVKEIASRFHMTPGAVMTLLSRTRGKLKRRLVKEGLIDE